MNYLKIKNKGQIQETALTLLGASTKRNQENKIGFFGSGNKFALAYLIRNNYEVSLFGGLNELKISTVKKLLGQEEFDVITINDQLTSITTEFGAKWKLWQALREVYSNALDEGEGTIELVNEISPKENETHYYIKIRAELIEWFGNYNSYFCENKEVVFENKFGRILKKHDDKGHLYRRGISVWHSDSNSLYDYDVPDITITEDRVVAYSWQIAERVWKLIYSCTNEEVIKNILTNSANTGMFEGKVSDYSDISSNEISEEFKSVLTSMRVVSKNMTGYLKEDERQSTTVLPSEIYKSVNHLLGDDNKSKEFKVGLDGTFYRAFEFSGLHIATLDKVKEFCKEANFTEVLQYEIVGGIFERKSIMGYADRGQKQIVVSDLGIEKGANYLLEIIIEEYIHLKYDAQDETRAFQDGIIQELVKILKVKNTFAL